MYLCTMEKQVRLREIVAAGADALTTDDKEFVKAEAAAAGLDFKPRQRCKNCYIDVALELWKMGRKAEAPKTDDGRRYVLHPDVNVRFSGVVINAATLTDEKAAEYIALGFPTSYFERIPTEGEK